MLLRFGFGLLLPAVLAGCTAPATRLDPPPGRVPLAVAVLHHWDAVRAAAWARGDVAALARLYLPGAPTGVHDRALLRHYLDRGLTVRGLQMQVLEARVLVLRPAALSVAVLERFAGAQVHGTGIDRHLPAGVPTRRVIDLRRYDGRWVVVAVTQSPRAAPP